MSNPALFLDLDGTVRETISGKQFINNDYKDQQAIAKSRNAILYFYRKNYLIFGITNQKGVKAGHKTLENCILGEKFTSKMFVTDSGDSLFRAILFCPDDGKQLGKVNDCMGKILSKRHLEEVYNGVPPEDFDPTMGHQFPSFRKPEPGMIDYLLATYDIDLKESLIVGDMESDRELAARKQCPFLWAEQWRQFFGDK